MVIARRFGLVSALVLVLGTAACDSERHGREAEGAGEQAGEASDGKKSITIKGSDTMVILAQRWAEAYMKANPGVSVQVSGGGSGTGIAALINGTTDIANASRAMKDREKKQVQDRQGAAPKEVPVALDALAVYVHEDNSVESLTFQQLQRIYRAKVDNWKDVGGPDRDITLYGRENNSGTYVYFKENVLDNMDFASDTQTLPGTSAVINAVGKDTGGIGYGGIGYAEGVRTVPVAPEGGDPVEPTKENATGGEYPLARSLYMYTPGEPKGRIADFIEFVRSPEGQDVVEGAGYYPLPSEGSGGADGTADEDDDGASDG
ncbi:MAG: phosphate ABC transporter substrate-binding protein [Myxococcota bacterium]